ncbi:hypothetical protein HZS_6018 [Henneguya salminicola]|nr:hypothetical protein HZS_6018 [Henneguya salminicola]
MVSKNFPQTEVIEMSKNYPKQIFVGFLDMAKLTSSQSGLQHTKTFIIDKKSFYLGSANCDWRAYSEVVEIGIFGLNIKNATEDILKIFEMYWYVSYLKQPLPQRWPRKFSPYFGKCAKKNPNV